MYRRRRRRGKRGDIVRREAPKRQGRTLSRTAPSCAVLPCPFQPCLGSIADMAGGQTGLRGWLNTAAGLLLWLVAVMLLLRERQGRPSGLSLPVRGGARSARLFQQRESIRESIEFAPVADRTLRQSDTFHSPRPVLLPPTTLDNGFIGSANATAPVYLIGMQVCLQCHASF